MIRVVHPRIPDPDGDFLPIPDPGVKKPPDPGSGSATLLLILMRTYEIIVGRLYLELKSAIVFKTKVGVKIL
jgi:hypothetical protein